jgi:DNA-binding transcriptional ArsR family regulator
MPADAADDVDWDTVGFVRASDYRTRVVDALADGPATPTTVGEQTGLDITHVSRTISELRDHELAELLVPEERTKGRIYGLTDAGQTVATEVEA